ncbi:HNH endonuclease [Patescibacteria group bacterium]|nr:HNH endonuclease [Patescibacteria group bacterium]
MSATSRIIRAMIFVAQDGKCFYCDRPLWGAVESKGKQFDSNHTIDHVVPRSDGGQGGRNLVIACLRCNQDKGHRMPTEDEIQRAIALHNKVAYLIEAFRGLPLTGWSYSKDAT